MIALVALWIQLSGIPGAIGSGLVDLATFLHLREANAVLGLASSFGLCYRTPQALRGVSSKRLYLILASFPPLVGLGSVSAHVQDAPIGPFVPLLTVSLIALVWVCIFWPKRLGN